MRTRRISRRSGCAALARAALVCAALALSPPPPAQGVEPAVTLATAAVSASDPDELTVAAVQFEVTEARFRSLAALSAELDALVRRANRRYEADVVVFPEYLNVFLLASRYPDAVADADDLYAALASIAGGDDSASTAVAPRAVLAARAEWIAAHAQAIWSEIARRHEVVLVAGTLFARADGGSAAPADAAARGDHGSAAGTGLRNRLLVYGPDGDLAYTQDKVYLTPVEADILGIEPGRLADAAPVVVDGVEIGFTICRDTFFDSWERRLGGVDLWIDLRANGEPYSDEVYRRFLGTLPERVATTDASAGLNASLTGEFLGHVWAGPSYAVAADGSRIAASEEPIGTQITALRLTRHGTRWTPVALSTAAEREPTANR